MAQFIGAIDQGTTSSRFIVFNRAGEIVSSAQEEHEQIYPKPGWVEHDSEEIWRKTTAVIERAMASAKLKKGDLAAIGITNQRETTVVWNRNTGKPVYNAIVWQDTRVADDVAEFSKKGGQDRYRAKTGLPLACYFSALKIRWILNNVAGAREQAEAGELACGTIDSFLIWKLTGGSDGGIHLTDVTNASRTQLMDLSTLNWDANILRDFGIPAQMLPKIVSSSEVYGDATLHVLQGIPIAGVLGDQQAALVGQACFKPGDAKNTYGTGCFMLMNTGTRPVLSKCGLLTTVAYRLGSAPTHYALEGSIDYGCAGSVDSRQPGIDLHQCGCRTAREDRRRQRWRIFRARFLGALCAVLEGQCARRDCRADAIRQQGTYCPRRAGSDCLPGARSGRGDGAGFRRKGRRAARRRRHGRQ